MKNAVLGIDIGGTNIKFGLVDERGKILHSDQLKTSDYDQIEDLVQIIYEITTQWSDHKLLVAGIGIGAPNGHRGKGQIVNPPNLSWGTVDVKSPFEKVFKLPVMLENDANAMAIGEGLFGAARGLKDFIVITLGTGLGSGIVCNNHLVHGANMMAGEAGHIVVDPKGRKCSCGGVGHLEAYVSSRGILQTMREISSLECKNVEELSVLAEENNQEALCVFQKTSEYFALGLSTLATLFVPEKIVISGGLSKSLKYMQQEVEQNLDKLVFPPFKGQVQIVQGALCPENGALLGAAALIQNSI